MANLKWILPITCLTAISCQSALANGAALPQLPAYYAHPPAEPALSTKVSDSFSWLKNFYVTVEGGRSFTDISSIDNETGVPALFAPASVAKTSISEAVSNIGAAIGYQIRESGIFSRIEIQYINRGKIDYKANPALNFSAMPSPTVSIDSTIKNQTILGKIYWDFNYGIFVIPYIDVGAGVSFNRTKTNGSYQSPFVPMPTTSNITSNNTNLAAAGGAGLRFKITKHLFAGIAYQFDYLGKVNWELNTDIPGQPIELKAKNLYSNSVNLKVTLKG